MKTIYTMPSTDQQTQLNVVSWQNPDKQQPVAILQIVHGMAEYIERYDAFASYLTKANILVVGHDHLGHGDSVNQNNPLYGYFSKKDGPRVLVEDVYTVTNAIQKNYPDVPYFILGHSMGSFVLRNYLKKYGDLVSGAIIMGTGGPRPELNLVLPLLHSLNQVAPKKENKTIDQLAFGSYANAFDENFSSFDWLSKNPDNVLNYIEDPKLGFVFTNNAFWTLFTLIKQATQKDWMTPIPTTLPILLVSGEEDPVGQMGKGPRKVAKELSEHGFTDVSLRLYAQLRHEILNEIEAPFIYADLLEWLKKRI